MWYKGQKKLKLQMLKTKKKKVITLNILHTYIKVILELMDFKKI